VEARGLAASPTGRRPPARRRLPPRSSPRPGQKRHQRPRTPASGAPERGRSLERAPARGLLVHRRDHPGIGRDRETARSVANSIGLVAAGRSAGQSLQRSRSPWRAALAGRGAGCGEPHDATDDSRGPRRTWPRRSEARRAIRVASEKSARFFVASSASRARATSIGRTEARSPVGGRARATASTDARRLAGDDQPGDAHTLGERERPVRDLVDHPPPTREPCRRTWAGEHGLGERARLVIGEDGGLRRRREVDAEDRARRPDDGTTSGPARVAP